MQHPDSSLAIGYPLRILTADSPLFFVGIGGQVFVRADQAEGSYSGTLR